MSHWQVAAHCGGHALQLAAASGQAGPCEHGKLRHDYRHVLHENAVRLLRQRRQPLDAAAERRQLQRIALVLACGARDVDCLAREERQFAVRE